MEAIELIAKDHQLQQDETTRDILSGNFAGLPSTLLTLLQFVTLDDVADVYFPLIMAKPYLCAFFFPILMFISVGLMNLVTASLVENAMQTAALEAEEERLKLKKKVKNAEASVVQASTSRRKHQCRVRDASFVVSCAVPHSIIYIYIYIYYIVIFISQFCPALRLCHL